MHFDTWIVTTVQYNSVEKKMNEEIDLSAFAIVKGDYVISMQQYSANSIIICGGQH